MLDREIYCSKSGKVFNKIFKNFSFLSFGKIGGDFFTFVLFVVLSRKFGQEGIGQYSFALGLGGFFALCADFGLYNFSIKEISRHKDSREDYLQIIFSLRAVQSLIILILLLVIIPILPFSYGTKFIIIILGIYLITYIIIDGFSAVFIAYEKMHLAAMMEMTVKTITASSAIVISLLGGSIINALLMFPIMSILQLLIVIRISRKVIGKITLSFSFKSLLNTFKQTITFGTTDLLLQIYLRIDIVLIGFLLGESSAGLYNVGYRVVFFLLLIPKFASIALFPIVSQLFRDSRFEFDKMYNKSLNMMIVIGLPISAGLLLIAPEFIGLVFGVEFTGSSTVLRILSNLFLLNCLSQIMDIFLMASDQQTARAKIQWVATLVCILSNLVFIRLFNIEGSAIAVVLSSLLLLILYALKLKAVVGLPDIKSKLLICLLGVLVFFTIFSVLPISIFISVPLSMLIYLGIITLFANVRNNEIDMIFNLIKGFVLKLHA